MRSLMRAPAIPAPTAAKLFGVPPSKTSAFAPQPLLLINIGQLLTLCSAAPAPKRGPALKELGIMEDAAVLCSGGKIVSVGTTRDALRDAWLKNNRKKVTELDCAGKVVLPGFVDSHTHPA